MLIKQLCLRGIANAHNMMHNNALKPGLMDNLTAARMVILNAQGKNKTSANAMRQQLRAQLPQSDSVAGAHLGMADCSEATFSLLCKCLMGNWMPEVSEHWSSVSCVRMCSLNVISLSGLLSNPMLTAMGVFLVGCLTPLPCFAEEEEEDKAAPCPDRV